MAKMLPPVQMCQTEDHFDCQPAVLAALDFAKTANNGGIEDAEMAKKIDFEEFGAFLQAVKLYYSFCEVNVALIFPGYKIFLRTN